MGREREGQFQLIFKKRRQCQHEHSRQRQLAGARDAYDVVTVNEEIPEYDGIQAAACARITAITELEVDKQYPCGTRPESFKEEDYGG